MGISLLFFWSLNFFWSTKYTRAVILAKNLSNLYLKLLAVQDTRILQTCGYLMVLGYKYWIHSLNKTGSEFQFIIWQLLEVLSSPDIKDFYKVHTDIFTSE